MIIPTGTIVAVIDGERMRLFRNNAAEPEISLAAVAEPEFDPQSGGSGTRHRSSAANPDASRLEEDDFVAGAASVLNRQALDGRIEKLVIIADPRSLGELRRHMHAVLDGKVIGELAKDLAGHPIEAIQKALADAR